MSNSKTWAREFAEGFDELNTSQRYQRAKFIVREGIEAGHDISEIAEATEWYGENKLSRQTVQQYIDLYAVSEGATRSGTPISAGKDRIQAAMNMYDVPVEDDEVAEYVAETGASEDLARRIIRGQKVGEALEADGLVNDDGTLDVPDPRRLDKQKLDAYRVHGAWMTRFGAKEIRATEFIQMLRDTKQDEMRDSTVARKLRALAGHFEKQADRFEVGHAKTAAKQQAAGRIAK